MFRNNIYCRSAPDLSNTRAYSIVIDRNYSETTTRQDPKYETVDEHEENLDESFYTDVSHYEEYQHNRVRRGSSNNNMMSPTNTSTTVVPPRPKGKESEVTRLEAQYELVDEINPGEPQEIYSVVDEDHM